MFPIPLRARPLRGGLSGARRDEANLRRSRRRFAAARLLVAGVVALAISPTRSSSASDALRVMSFNLRYATAPDGPNSWEHRRGLLLDTIRRFDPDLLGTQECLEIQAAYLRDSLPHLGFVGVGRDDGKLAGEMCALFYRADRFHKLSEGHFWLSETPEVPGSRSWDSALPRIASWVRLRSRSDTTITVLFLNTHFDHQGEEARLRSAELLANWLGNHRDGARLVVTGDFNAPASAGRAGPYRTLAGCARRGAHPLIDAFRVRHAPGPAEGTYHAFTGRTDGDRIDWILFSGDLAPQEAEIVRANDRGRYPSDHFPVTSVARVLAKRPTVEQADARGAGTPPRFAEEIARFERENADLAGRHDGGGPGDLVLFVGSSSIRMWETLERDFPDLSVVNRGFGGSEFEDVLRNLDRIVHPLEPRWIVLYEGDNDLESGKTPERVRDDFREFCARVRSRLPETRIAVLSIKPSPARWRLEPQARAANALIRACCDPDEADSRCVYVDLFTPMLGPDGKPRAELFLEDGLHLNPAGYELWRASLAPILTGGR